MRSNASLAPTATTYRYYLTRAGRAAIAAGRRLTEQTIIPALAGQICSQDANTEVVSD